MAIGVGTSPEVLFAISLDSTADSCHRAHFLEELPKLIADGIAELNKHLEDIEESPDVGR